MTEFSANLGFLWTDRPLAEAIYAAKEAGFVAVECHWPYDQPVDAVKAALIETGLPMLGLNTRPGQPGENGLSALPGREEDARAAIDEAISYADRINAGSIHVMAGIAQGEDARQSFVESLRHACTATARTILIEPLNRNDAPGYFLETTGQALAIIEEIAVPNLKLMFDCYHVGRNEGDVITRLTELLPHIGHIQFASIPHRGPPDAGELHYPAVFSEIRRLGWRKPLGAEYKSTGPTEDSLDWMQEFMD